LGFHDGARFLVYLATSAVAVAVERAEVQPGLAVHAHFAHRVVQQLGHPGDVVVRAVGGAFFAKEKFLVGLLEATDLRQR
jgi:hypothetical protein